MLELVVYEDLRNHGPETRKSWMKVGSCGNDILPIMQGRVAFLMLFKILCSYFMSVI